MKKLIFFTLVTISLITSCSPESGDNAAHPNSTASDLQSRSGNNEADQQMAQLLLHKYGIKTTSIGENAFSFRYPDGRFLTVKLVEDQAILSGTKLNNVTYTINRLSQSQIDQLDQTTHFLRSDIPTEDFIFNVNDLSNLSEQEIAAARPCNQHPRNESFNQCFKREWAEFCDGLIGCLAQATNPVPVAIAIAIHCAAC